MKILHVITGLGVGGAETALCRLIESLPGPDYAHIVVCLGKEEALSARIRQSGAELDHLEMRSGGSISKAFLTLRGLVKNARADVIHGWMYHANVAAALAVFKTDGQLLWGIRCAPDDLSREKRLTRILVTGGRVLSGLPRAIVYNSTASARQHEAIGYRRDKTRIIPNGFDTTIFKPDYAARSRIREELRIPENAFVVGLVARWHPVKDHVGFLRAAADFSRKCGSAVFVLAGDGVGMENGTLQELASSLGILKHLRLCGRRSDVAALMAAMDVGCSSSAWGEAFPNVIGETMACAVPCVATDLGDVREIIGDTGRVVPPSNPAALSAGWLELERIGEHARRSLGDESRRRISERYSLAACAAAYAELYRNMTGRDHVRHRGPLERSGKIGTGGL